MALRIEDYALIGDCETAALVGRDGSIDWLCWPRFDSDACFTALLGTPEHGRWLIGPKDVGARVTRRYRDGTLVLETRFETPDGAVTLIDFMPLRNQISDLVRIVRGERGRVAMHTEFIVRFVYGTTVPWVTRLDDGTLRAIAGPDMLLLRTPINLHGEGRKTIGEFDVGEGEEIPFVLSYSPSHLSPHRPVDPFAALERTEHYWRKWSGGLPQHGPWTEMVRRSVITLKALTYAPTGGIVAAPTTSLPEVLGGSRNWDYRYAWPRDASISVAAFLVAGKHREAPAFLAWLLHASRVARVGGDAGSAGPTENQPASGPPTSRPNTGAE